MAPTAIWNFKAACVGLKQRICCVQGVVLPEGYSADVKARERLGSENTVRLDTVDVIVCRACCIACIIIVRLAIRFSCRVRACTRSVLLPPRLP